MTALQWPGGGGWGWEVCGLESVEVCVAENMCLSTQWSAHACMPCGRREVLAASLGTYKPCGRICLRCQPKAFSNVHPTPSPRVRAVRGLRNPVLPAASQPPAPPGGTAGALTTVSWPSLFPGGPKAEEGDSSSCLTSPLSREGLEACPSRPPFCNCSINLHKMGPPWLCSA